MRSEYTVGREKFTRSGQGEHENFDLFTDGDETLSYMHCVFYGLSSLEGIVRCLPEGADVECGIDELECSREYLKQDKTKIHKKSTADQALALGLIGIANSMSAPGNINLNDRHVTGESSDRFIEFDISDRNTISVEKLMTLESDIIEKLCIAKEKGDTEFADILKDRAEQVRKRIEKALCTE